MPRAKRESEIGGSLEACRARARWDSEIGDFLEACWDGARWESEIGDALETCRARTRCESEIGDSRSLQVNYPDSHSCKQETPAQTRWKVRETPHLCPLISKCAPWHARTQACTLTTYARIS